MFFAPPQVKSLSRYAEFGTYLDFRYFLMMVAVAMAIHASIFGMYALMPREEVIRVPVRALNIKLGSEDALTEEAPQPPLLNLEQNTPSPTAAKVNIPVPPPLPAVEPEKPKQVNPKAAETAAEKALARAMKTKPTIYTPPHTKTAHHPTPASNGERKRAPAAADYSLATPKRYVREGDMPGSKPGVKAGSAGGSAAGEEIIHRYEQTISLWIAGHKIYPEAAKRQGIEGDAVVRIRINRQGHILYNAIDRSSGNAMIDAAVINMVHAADPVPEVPSDYPTASQLEFLIPVSFRLQ